MGKLATIVAYVLAVSVVVVAGGVVTNVSDAHTMHNLAAATGADRELKLNWTAGSDPCGSGWLDIICNELGRVIRIHVENISLNGSLPSELNQLSSLEWLGFVRCQLTGPLPLLQLPLLYTLKLEGNLFTVMPPGFFSGFSSLQHFSASDNPSLEDWELPMDLRGLTQLASFEVDNAGVNGTVVDFLGDGDDNAFRILVKVSLSRNKLHGPIPEKFATNLQRRLQHLDLSHNYLSGPINSFSSFQSMAKLYIHDNQFTGPLPDFENLRLLQVLSVAHKNVTEVASTALTQLDLLLQVLSIANNNLTGVVPTALTQLDHIDFVSLAGNLLQGPVPTFATKVQNDVDAAATYGSFCRVDRGPCDPRVEALLSVASGFNYPEVLGVSWRRNDPCAQWVGVQCDASGSTIVGLNLCRLGLNGSLDPAIGSLKSVTTILLSGNNISGVIPPSVAELPSLRLLDIADNSLEGPMPEFHCDVQIWADSKLNMTSCSLATMPVKPFRAAGVAVATILVAAVAGVL